MPDKNIQQYTDKDIEILIIRLNKIEEENYALKSQLEQVNKERVQYLQNVSHQLVAPLNAIKWHIENITEARIGVERAKKVLRSIYSQATIAVHLAKNFNLMSNLDADHTLSALKEPLQEINLYRLLVNLANDFQPLAWDQNIQIEVIQSQFDSAPDVLAMRPLISQVFSNIIENAVKYSNKFTKIEMRGFYNKEKDTFSVHVKNYGIVIENEDINCIFDRGFRSSEAKNRYPAGTGFGLYIAKRIVEIHEGTIGVYTDENDWVTFTVTLSVSGLEGKARKRA